MRKIIVLLVALASPASAQTYTEQKFGNQTFITGPNGYNATEQHFGGQTFGNDSQGNSWNVQRFGDQTFTNFTPGGLQ